jgi:predicted NBD/HSP70 family sugar kinase
MQRLLFRGSRGLGAEFAHTKVQIDGALCRCGQRGCLEAYVADYALAREAAVTIDIDEHATMLKQLASQAKQGHAISASIYRRAGRMLGLGLANLINVFDPPSGEHIHNHDLIAAEVRRTIDANALSIDRPPVRIAVHRWGDQLWARGAGALALDGLTAHAYTTPASGEVT